MGLEFTGFLLVVVRIKFDNVFIECSYFFSGRDYC